MQSMWMAFFGQRRSLHAIAVGPTGKALLKASGDSPRRMKGVCKEDPKDRTDFEIQMGT